MLFGKISKYTRKNFFIYLLIFTCSINNAQNYYDLLTKTPLDRNVFNDVSLGFGYFEGTHYHQSPPPSGTDGRGVLGLFGIYLPNIRANAPKNAKLYTHRSTGVGIKYTHTRTYGEFDKLTLIVNYTSGLNKELDTLPLSNVSFYNFHTSAQYDYKWFGASLGLHYGYNFQEKAMYMVYFGHYNVAENYLAPSISLRLFPYNKIYIKASYNDYFPFVLGARSKLSYRFIAGTGLGRANGSCLELGYDRVGGPFCTLKWISQYNYGFEINAFLPVTEDYTNKLIMASLMIRLNSKHWEKKYF